MDQTVFVVCLATIYACGFGLSTGYGFQMRECNTSLCPVDGTWSEWSLFSECSASCGQGVQRRIRQCLGKASDGKPCPGNDYELRLCGNSPCEQGRLSGTNFSLTWWCGGVIAFVVLMCDMLLLFDCACTIWFDFTNWCNSCIYHWEIFIGCIMQIIDSMVHPVLFACNTCCIQRLECLQTCFPKFSEESVSNNR